MSDTEKATRQMKRVYTRGYEEAFAADPLGDRGSWITGGVRAVAEWAREAGRLAALEEAAEVARKSGGEWIDLYQPNAKLPPMEDFIADDILALRSSSPEGSRQ